MSVVDWAQSKIAHSADARKPWWMLLGLLLLTGTPPVLAAPKVWIRGDQPLGTVGQPRGAHPADFSVTFTAVPTELQGTITYTWDVRDASGTVVDTKTTTAKTFTYVFPKDRGKFGEWSVTVTARDQYGTNATVRRGVDVGKPSPTRIPQTPPPPPPRPAGNELRGVTLSGPDTLKVGEEGRWRGEATGGAGHTHQWIVEFRGNRIVRPEKDGGITVIPATPKQPGTMTLTLLVWDNTTPKAAAKRAVKEVTVVPVAPRPNQPRGASAVEGWWTGMVRPPDNSRPVTEQYIIPLHIRSLGEGKYVVNIFASLNGPGIPDRGTAPWKFRATGQGRRLSGRLNFPGQASTTGSGTLNASGGQLSGNWVGPDGKSTPWTFRRATAREAARFQSSYPQ